MDASELRDAREQLILKRNRIMKRLRSDMSAWTEFHEICRAILALDKKLDDRVSAEETKDSAE